MSYVHHKFTKTDEVAFVFNRNPRKRQIFCGGMEIETKGSEFKNKKQ